MTPLQVPVNELSPWQPGIFSLVFYAILVFGAIVALLFVISWLGERRPSPEKSVPYECGIVPTGSARFRHPVPFYLVAIFFLIFDIEAAFIFSWAVAFVPLGVAGWLRICSFIFVLLISLFYLWAKGGLDWRRRRTIR